MTLRMALAVTSVLFSTRFAGPVERAAAGDPVRSAREIVTPADSDGIVYLFGQRVVPPYRIALDGERVLVNGIDTDPTGGPDVSPGAPLSADVERVLGAIRSATERADAAIDSIRAAGAAPEAADERAARIFRDDPLVADVWVRPTGGLEVTWNGVPGRQLVMTGPGRAVDPSARLDPDAVVRSRFEWLAASLARGDLYAAGVGYRISLSGALVDSMEAAVARFAASEDDTLRVGRRAYFAFGEDLRRVAARRGGR